MTRLNHKWEQVIRQWSVRRVKKVVGWWFDGYYWPNSMTAIEQELGGLEAPSDLNRKGKR
jgi:hypothetical protein